MEFQAHRPRTKVIAEAGVNHNGDPELAFRLIDAAADAGADIVKFQTFRTRDLVVSNATKAPYQQANCGSEESQDAMLQRLELPYQVHYQLRDHAHRRGIEFLSTPFDLTSLNFLVRELGLTTIKIPSGEVTNGPLLLAAAQLGVDVILSTGMSRLGEVENALAVLAYGYMAPEGMPKSDAFEAAYCSAEGQDALSHKVILLHCTTEYPTAYEDVNLRTMDTLAAAFGLSVGLSDHTPGIAIPLAAAARGASVVEKHFTLDRALPGPDHLASIEPTELSALVQGVAQVAAALGSPRKQPVASELPNRMVARRSLVASRPISAGELFSPDNLIAKRPTGGLSPMLFWDLLGQRATRDFAKDEFVE